MSSDNKQVCAACGHSMEMHFRNVLDQVRCIITDHGVSTAGILGMPWETPCDCTDYHSERAEAKKREPFCWED